MKRPALLFVLLTLGTSPTWSMTEAECSDKALRAESIMLARQNGEPLEPALDVLKDPAIPQDMLATAKELLFAAYQEPRMASAIDRQLAVANFRDKVHVACLAESN